MIVFRHNPFKNEKQLFVYPFSVGKERTTCIRLKAVSIYGKIGKTNKRMAEAAIVYSTDPELKKIQKADLEMAQYSVDFYKSHDLLCYFCGGGVIGAIRHKGFILWDDDLDFLMPRRDYDCLAESWGTGPQKDKFVLLRPTLTNHDRNSLTTIRNVQITFIKTYQEDLDILHGIQLDISPLDIAPEEQTERKKQKIWVMTYALYRSQQVPQNHGKATGLAGKLSLNSVPAETKYKIWGYAEKQMIKYNDNPTNLVTELCVGPRYMGNVYPAKDFESAVWVPFEDTEMSAPTGYDHYSSQVFGDYMQLPPEKDQASHYEATYIDPEHSYKMYKGKYYLTKGIEKE